MDSIYNLRYGLIHGVLVGHLPCSYRWYVEPPKPLLPHFSNLIKCNTTCRCRISTFNMYAKCQEIASLRGQGQLRAIRHCFHRHRKPSSSITFLRVTKIAITRCKAMLNIDTHLRFRQNRKDGPYWLFTT